MGEAINEVIGAHSVAFLRWTDAEWEEPLSAALEERYSDTSDYGATYNMATARDPSPADRGAMYNQAALDLLDDCDIPSDAEWAIFLPTGPMSQDTGELDVNVPPLVFSDCGADFEPRGRTQMARGFLHRRWNSHHARAVMQASFTSQLDSFPRMIRAFRTHRTVLDYQGALDPFWDNVWQWIQPFATFLHELTHAGFDLLPIDFRDGDPETCSGLDPRAIASEPDVTFDCSAHQMCSIIGHETGEAFVLGRPTGGGLAYSCGADLG